MEVISIMLATSLRGVKKKQKQIYCRNFTEKKQRLSSTAFNLHDTKYILVLFFQLLELQSVHIRTENIADKRILKISRS